MSLHKDILVLRRRASGRGEPSHNQVRDFYEILPCGGDSIADDGRWRRLPWLEGEFEPEACAGKKVLDIGCGIGIDMQQFLENLAHVVGVDFASTPLIYAQTRLASSISQRRWDLIRADARFLPFKDGVFDYSYSNGVLHHIADYDRVLQEAHRCLKGGGQATILVYHKRSLMTLLTVLYRLALKRRGQQGGYPAPLRSIDESKATRAGYEEVIRHPLIQYFSKQAFECSVRGAGFDVIRVTAYDWAFPLRRRMGRKAGLLDNWFGRFLIGRLAKGKQVVRS